MFDIIKFGKALSTLRKKFDMTQSEVADKLNCTRQAISKYERGENFPDVSVLVLISDFFDVTLDRLIGYGDPTTGEALILENIAKGNEDIVAKNISDVVNLAPLLKPSVLERLSYRFQEQGIDISAVVAIAEYLNDETVTKLIENASFEEISDEIIERFIPLLNNQSKEVIFQKILDGDMDWHLIKVLLPHTDYITTQIEAAVVAGALPKDVLDVLNDYYLCRNGYCQENNKL